MSATMIAVALKRTLDKLTAQGVRVSGEDGANCVLLIAVAVAREGGMVRERFDEIVDESWNDWSRLMGPKGN